MERESNRDYANEPPLTLSERLSTQLSAKGQHIAAGAKGSWQGFLFLSAVDQTTIPEPAVPVRRHQLFHSYRDDYRLRFQVNAFRMSMTTGEWSSRLPAN